MTYFSMQNTANCFNNISMSDSLKLENQLCHRFYLLSNAFTRAYRPMLEALDLTYSQYLVLMALWEVDDITIAMLLERTGIDGGAMSPILKRLTQKAYIDIRKDEQDKRVKLVTLTEQGRALKQQAAAIPTQMLCKLDNMALTEAKALIEQLDKLKQCLIPSEQE